MVAAVGVWGDWVAVVEALAWVAVVEARVWVAVVEARVWVGPGVAGGVKASNCLLEVVAAVGGRPHCKSSVRPEAKRHPKNSPATVDSPRRELGLGQWPSGGW